MQYVIANEIPKPFAAQFVIDMAHLALIGEVEDLEAEVIFHARDWKEWASGESELGFPVFKFREDIMELPYGLDEVPIRADGALKYIRAEDIPEPYQGQFKKAMSGQGQPTFEGREDTYYAWDWQEWASGNWRWGGKPEPA